MITIYDNRYLILINEVIDVFTGAAECFYEIYDYAQGKLIIDDRYDSGKEVLLNMIKYGLNRLGEIPGIKE